jgi:hypothetical protein
MKASIFISLMMCLFLGTPINARSENRPPQYFCSKEWKKEVNDTIKPDTLPIFTLVDENPHFAGGDSEKWKWLSTNIKYPADARENGDYGTIYVGFVVEVDGSLSNITIKRATYYNRCRSSKLDSTIDVKCHTKGLEIESVRVIAAMPPWIPGKNKGVPVRVAYTLPLKYWLE